MGYTSTKESIEEKRTERDAAVQIETPQPAADWFPNSAKALKAISESREAAWLRSLIPWRR